MTPAPTKAPYDPKLREAAEEFKALCQKYDCAGVVLFCSPTHSEFVNYLSPSWSVMRVEPPNGLRFSSKRGDFATQEEQHRCTEATAHVLTSILEWSRQVNTSMRGVIEQLGKHMKIGWGVWSAPDSVPGDGK